MIFGVYGACRRLELVSLLTSNVQDYETHFLVKLVDTKTKVDRSFIILPGQIEKLNLLHIIRTYMGLRSPKTPHNRFFVNYIKNKCTVQPVGIHKIGGVPAAVAKFLELPNHTSYTGHCFRRTSATLLANSGATIDGIKRHGGWRSSTVAEGYVDESEKMKINTASKILGSRENEPSTSTSWQPSVSSAVQPSPPMQPSTSSTLLQSSLQVDEQEIDISNDKKRLIISHNSNCFIKINYKS